MFLKPQHTQKSFSEHSLNEKRRTIKDIRECYKLLYGYNMNELELIVDKKLKGNIVGVDKVNDGHFNIESAYAHLVRVTDSFKKNGKK